MDKKEAILQAAMALFSEKGYKGTSISDITERRRDRCRYVLSLF